jgi:AcrR family transcriptional regulator
MGLREIKKSRARMSILKTARDMFFSRGFDGTTIEAIAEKAEVAVGTVYNYFESKSAIILAITADDTSEALYEKFQLPESSTGVEGIKQYVNTFMKSLSLYPKRLLRELMREGWTGKPLSDGLISQDHTLLSGLAGVLLELKENHRLSSDTDIEHASMVIYGTVSTALMWFAADENRTSEQMMESLEKMLEVLFIGLAPEGKIV